MSSTGPADDQLKERITQLEYKLEALEKTLPAAIVEKMDGHASAKQADARGQYSIGECQQVVIEEVTDDAGGSQGVSHLQGLLCSLIPVTCQWQWVTPSKSNSLMSSPTCSTDWPSTVLTPPMSHCSPDYC